jgi:hypothetical protein
MTVAPITPNEAIAAKRDAIPDFVFEAFNHLIKLNVSRSGTARILQKDVVAHIVKHGATWDDQKVTSEMIYRNRWFDVEEVYRKAGWKVTYDQPASGECFEAWFEFRSALR